MAWEFFKLVIVPALTPWLIWASFSLLEMRLNSRDDRRRKHGSKTHNKTHFA